MPTPIITLGPTPYGELEDWTTMLRMVRPTGELLTPADLGTIEVEVYDESSPGDQGFPPARQTPLYRKAGIVPTDNVGHAYSDPDILTATLRTEGWDGPGLGYNFIYVVEQSAFQVAAESLAGVFTTKGGRRYRILYIFKTSAGQWGTLTAEHLIDVDPGQR